MLQPGAPVRLQYGIVCSVQFIPLKAIILLTTVSNFARRAAVVNTINIITIMRLMKTTKTKHTSTNNIRLYSKQLS